MVDHADRPLQKPIMLVEHGVCQLPNQKEAIA
ncbi:hypothetical protein RUMTOR_02254 [[Ruminococcus] torques ATCC 27756]|uniref:Uncharacterized protein n=1 Tax=[Ruminococcus] torques ATCC 27756 TaxID=411460 RepID=A5KPS0_9FIRM|nr:hypothetical protein RUMTOR_02254 [[Ruminococcus] torques ATCC 27756]